MNNCAVSVNLVEFPISLRYVWNDYVLWVESFTFGFLLKCSRNIYHFARKNNRSDCSQNKLMPTTVEVIWIWQQVNTSDTQNIWLHERHNIQLTFRVYSFCDVQVSKYWIQSVCACACFSAFRIRFHFDGMSIRMRQNTSISHCHHLAHSVLSVCISFTSTIGCVCTVAEKK